MKIYGKLELGISMTYIGTEITYLGTDIEIIGIEEKDLVKTVLRLIDDLIELATQKDFATVEVVSLPPFNARVLRKCYKEIKRKISPFNPSYHLPWNVFGEWNWTVSRQKTSEQLSIEELKSLIDIAAKLEIQQLIIHPGFYWTPSLYEEYRKIVNPDWTVLDSDLRFLAEKQILEIFDYVSERGMKLAVENLDYDSILFQTPREFKRFIKKGIRMALDTVHAMRSGVNPFDFLRAFGNKISEIHLTDGIQGTTLHFPIGSGKVDCLKILKQYTKVTQGKVILEPSYKEDVDKSIKFLKKNKAFDPLPLL